MFAQRLRLKFFPITLFAVIMGLSGLTIAFFRAYHLQWIPKILFEIMLFSTTILFLIIISIYLIKIIYHFDEVKKEFFHPIRVNFFPASSISFILLSIAYYSYFPLLSISFWFIGVLMHTFFTFYVISFWIRHNFEIIHSNPAWFIPVVGNILIPVIGIEFMPKEFSFFFFSIGLFFWIVLFTIIFYRIIFHHQLANKFLPTLFIFIAPAAVGFISYIKLTNSLDSIAYFMLFIGYFFVILLLFMSKDFFKIKFFVSWWAFTFPLDAITIASIVAYQLTGFIFFKLVSIVLLLVTTIVIGLVLYQTVLHIRKKEICVEE